MRIGVLALQGDFSSHFEKLRQHNAYPLLVKKPKELESIDGLVIPGGESTTLLKLMDEGFMDALINFFDSDKPCLATCAGLILLAREVINPSQYSLKTLDIKVERNGYGSQINSFISSELESTGNEKIVGQEGVFIRAPKIIRYGDNVSVLLTSGGNPVCVQQGKVIGATFHPELSAGRSPLVEHFLQTI